MFSTVSRVHLFFARSQKNEVTHKKTIEKRDLQPQRKKDAADLSNIVKKSSILGAKIAPKFDPGGFRKPRGLEIGPRALLNGFRLRKIHQHAAAKKMPSAPHGFQTAGGGVFAGTRPRGEAQLSKKDDKTTTPNRI